MFKAILKFMFNLCEKTKTFCKKFTNKHNINIRKQLKITRSVLNRTYNMKSYINKHTVIIMIKNYTVY